MLELAPTVPRELRAVTQPGLEPERYAALAIPAVVLMGTRSPVTQRRNCERFAACLPRAGLEPLGGVGHVAHTGPPELVAAAVRAFLSERARRGQPSQAESSSSAPGTT